MAETVPKEEKHPNTVDSPFLTPITAPPTADSSPFLYTFNSVFTRPTAILLLTPNEEPSYYKTIKTTTEIITSFGINLIIKSLVGNCLFHSTPFFK